MNDNSRFQYIACQFEELQYLKTKSDIQKALQNLPEGLDKTYERMLQSVRLHNRKRVLNVLKWLAFFHKPLFLVELAEIFVLDHMAEIPFDKKDRLVDPRAVLGILRGLVFEVPVTTLVAYGVKRDTIEIRLAHFSIKEYLISSRISEGPAASFQITESDTNLHIAESCFAYHICLSGSIIASEKSLEEYPLWYTAVRGGPLHLERIPRAKWPKSVTTRAQRIFTRSSRSFLNTCCLDF